MSFSKFLTQAIKIGDLRIVAPLIKENKAWNMPIEQGLKPIHVAISYGHLHIVDWLLKNGVSLECAAIPYNPTPLHHATLKGQIKIVKHLLQVYHDNPNKKLEIGITPLHIAAQQGHIEIVALLLEYKADINPISIEGISPLHAAAKEGHTKIAALLLAHGADIHKANDKGACPLFAAARQGHTATVALLLDHHADIRQAIHEGASPLHIATYNGHTATVKLLLKRGADIRQTDNQGTSALFAAALQGHTQTVALLLERGADIRQANNKGESPLFAAARQGHTATVALLLDHHADIRQATQEGTSPLHIATYNGHTATVKVLLKRGANIRQTDNEGTSALFVAALQGHTQTVALLLKCGADIRQANIKGASPLFAAAQNGHRETVALLLEHGANIQQTMNNGVNPLYIAAFNGHTAIIKLLLNHGADIRQVNYEGFSALFAAAQQGHVAAVDLLLKHGADIRQADIEGRIPLFAAAQEGHTQIVALLLERGADIHQAMNNGVSALLLAAHNGHTATVALMLEHGADVRQTDNKGISALLIAINQGHLQTVALLLKYGADIHQTTNKGESPLFVAAAMGRTAMVALLLDYHADIHQTTHNGANPLYAAAQNNHTATVALLLERGADIQQINNDGKNSLSIAAQNGHTQTVALLLDHGADIHQTNNKGSSPLFSAAQKGHTATVALLLERGANIHQAVNNNGSSPLHIAAYHGHIETVTLLLNHRADIHQTTDNGISPLFAAAQQGHTAMVAFLLDHHANIHQANHDGASPLFIAAKQGHTATVSLLLNHDADVKQTTNDGATPLHIAAEQGHTAIVALLLDHHADICQTNNDGASPLYVAAQEGRTETVAFLLTRNADIDQARHNGASPLFAAAQFGHTATVVLLLDHHADINQTTKIDTNALYVAAQKNYIEIAALLLSHDVDIHQANNDGISTLNIAAYKGHTALVALLLDHGADIHKTDNNNRSPLYSAAHNGHTETVALLLDRSANIHQADLDGISPLLIAAKEGHLETVALLLDREADIHQANDIGVSPLFAAAQNGHTAIVALLLNHHADIGQTDNKGRSPLDSAAQAGQMETVALLLDRHANILQTRNDGTSALLIAAQAGHTEIVALLLDRGADIWQADNEGRSPLFVAALFGHHETVALLLRHGAPVEQAMFTQTTPFWVAASEGHVEVVQILLQNRALMTPDAQGNTPLHIAVKQGHIPVVKLLLSKSATVTSLNAKNETPLMLAACCQDAVMFAWLLAAWLQQQPKSSNPKSKNKQSLEIKKSQEVSFTRDQNIDTYKIISAIDNVLPQNYSHWPLLPPAALTLAKATRQSLGLEVHQQQWKQAVKLGEGAFGEVFGTALSFGQVALKRMKLEKITEWFKVTPEEAQAILQWEINQLEKVRHPHVVELLGVGQAETPILVMELCDTTLDKGIPKTPYTQWQVAWEVACGLAYLHHLSLVHRDIKLENILLKEGVAKIADMGLAQIDPLLLDKTEPTQLQSLIGDTEWASPEEKAAFKAYHEKKGNLDDIKKASTAATDIYRYGLVLNTFCQPLLRPLVEACLQQEAKHRPSALQVLSALEEKIPHDHSVLAKLCQRLGIFADYHQHELSHFLTPWVSPKADIDWLTYQEGIKVKGDDAPQPFSTIWHDFLSNSQKRRLDLRGVGGSGKTLLGYYQLKKHWQALRQWLINPQESPPTLVLILTPDYLQMTNFSLEKRLTEIYQLTPEECQTLKKDYSVIFLFDGENDWEAQPQLDLTKWPKAKVWKISRPSAHDKDCVYLLPFNHVQIVNYLRQTLIWDEATTTDFITQLPVSAIKEVLRNPFVLSMFRLLWPIPHWQDLTKEAIYHRYFTQFIEKQKQHWLTGPDRKMYEELIRHLQQQHPTLSESYLRFAGEVSLQLFEARRLEGKVAIDSPWTTMPAKIQNLAEQVFQEKQQLLSANNQKTRLTLQQYQAFSLAHLQRFVMPAPLELGYYRFRHKSLFEYAWAYSALLPNRPLEEDEALLTTYVQVHQEEKLDFTIIEASKNNPDLAAKAGNQLSLYNWARLPLRYNYQGSHIANANLAYANLVGADLRGATLSNCYFAHACIEKAHFDKTPKRTLANNRRHPPLLGHSEPILHSAISTNGQLLATLDKKQVFIWQNQQCIRHFLTDIEMPTALAIDDSGALLIGDIIGFVYFYSGDMRQRKLHAHYEPILRVEFISEDLCWVAGGYNNIIYNRKHYSPHRQWQTPYASVTCLAFHSPSGQHMVGTQNGGIALNSIKETPEKEIWYYILHQGETTALSFNNAGNFFASGGSDGKIAIYKKIKKSLEPWRTLHAQPVKSLHWSQDGQLLVAITSQGLKVWDAFGREQGNFKAAAIQAIYLKNSHEGILVEQSGNLYGIALDQGEINITWVIAGKHFQGGLSIQPINEALNKQPEEQKTAQVALKRNNSALPSPTLKQQGLFTNRNQPSQKPAVNIPKDAYHKNSSATRAKELKHDR